jgi:uncharacterized protein
MSETEIREFYDLIREIIETEEFFKMANQKHHIKTSIYDHCLKVAFLCYKHHHRFKCKTNIHEVMRAALLHDYFLYDRINKESGDDINRFIHLFKHPATALRNASIDYPDLTRKERNAIQRHMFPIVPIPPTSSCGWLVCYYDKIAAVGDYLHIQRWKKELMQYCPEALK